MQEQFKIIFQIWMQVWWMNTNRISKTKLWIYSFIIPLIGLIVSIAVYFGDPTAKRVWVFLLLGFAINIILLCGFGFIFLCEVVKMQYSPANSKLVPKIKRHLQFALAIPLLIFPLIALIVQSMINHELRIGVWGFVIFAMLSLCISIRSPWGLSLFIVSTQFPRIEKLSALKTMLAPEEIKLMLISLSFLLIIFVLHWTFSMREKEIFNLEKRNFKGLLNQNNLKNTNFMSKFINSPYLMWMTFRIKTSNLMTASKSTTNTSRNKSALQIFGLAPNVHWITSVFTILSMAIFTSVIILGLELLESDGQYKIKSFTDFSKGFLMVIVPLMPLLYVLNFSLTIYNSRREHGLLQLTPFGMKNPSLQNLSDHLLRAFGIQFFCFWIVGLVVSFSLGLAADFSSKALTVVLLGNLSTIFVSLVIFYKQNKRDNLYDPTMAFLALFSFVLFMIALVILYFFGLYFAWAFAACLVVLYCVSLSIIFGQRPKNTITFPAGRTV